MPFHPTVFIPMNSNTAEAFSGNQNYSHPNSENYKKLGHMSLRNLSLFH